MQDHGACQVEVFQVHSCKLDDRWLLSLSCLHWQSLWSHQWHDINSSCFTASTPQKYVCFFFVLVPLTFSWTKTLCAFGHGSGSPPGSPCTAPRSPILKQFRLVSDPSVIARLFTGKVVQNPEMRRDFFQEGADAADGIL